MTRKDYARALKMMTVTFLILLFAAQGWAAKRVALVIGNSAYQNAPLANPVNDAADMAQTLKRIGFTVIKRVNAGQKAMEDSLRQFKKQLSGAEVGLFYYAGHGMQVNGINYLIPVNSRIREESDVKYFAVDAGFALNKMKDAGAPLNIVILDACRNNPLKRSFRDASKGLAYMEAPEGTLLAYATKAGSVSEDGSGRNGTYTEALLRYIGTPGLDVRDMFNRVGLTVKEKTNNRQVPWTSNDPIPEYFLAGGAHEPVQSPRVKAPPQVSSKGAALDLDDLLAMAEKEKARKEELKRQIEKYGQLVKKTGDRYKDQAWQAICADFPLLSRGLAAGDVMGLKRAAGIDTWTEPTTGMEFVWVPGGCYQMGQTESEKQYLIQKAGQEEYNKWFKNELPRHEVCVDGFWMGKYEVTNRQYRMFKPGHDSKDYKGVDLNGDDQPVVSVSWEDAKAYIKWLNRKSGNTFKLPTEAQWEYAARAGTETIRYWGDSDNSACGYANVHDRTSKNRFSNFTWIHHDCSDGYAATAPVGSFKPNLFGLHDMLGNVWEWCEDWYGKGYYSQSSRNNPQGPSSGSSRVLRGGSWNCDPGFVRAANRSRDSPGDRGNSLGFRLLLPSGQ